MRALDMSFRARDILLGTLIVAGIAVGAYLVQALGLLWLAIFLGVVLATALAPVVDALAARRIPRGLAGTAVIGLLGVGVAALLLALIPSASNQLQALLAGIPRACERLRDWSGGLAPGMWTETIQRLVDSLCAISDDPSRLRPVLGPGWQYVGTVQSGVWVLVVVTAIGYFWARDRQAIMRAWLRLVSPARRDDARAFVEQVERRIGGFVRGQFLVAASVGVLAAGAYKLIGLPHALTLGLVAGVAEPIPIIGPLVAALWAASDGVLVDPGLVWQVALVAAGLRVLADYVLMPAIVGRSAETNAFLLLVTLVAMASLGGVIGAMVAVPLAALIQLGLEHALNRDNVHEAAPAARDRLGLLRYRARLIAEAARKAAPGASAGASIAPGSTGSLSVEDEIEVLARELRAWLETAQVHPPAGATPPPVAIVEEPRP